MNSVKAITFGTVADTQPLHVFCLVHHQVVRNKMPKLSQNSGTGVFQTKVGKKYDVLESSPGGGRRKLTKKLATNGATSMGVRVCR